MIDLYKKTVKLIATNKFEVEMLVAKDDSYYIRYHKLFLDNSEFSERITDFKTASYLFDLKVQELEGQ